MPSLLVDAYGSLSHLPIPTVAVALFLALLTIGFFTLFVPRALVMRSRLAALSSQIGSLKASGQIDPGQVAVRDDKLKHLWDQFVQTLHRTQSDTRTGLTRAHHYRATVPAEVIFNAAVVFEGRLRTEFFKHLPGLLTGLGIIGTFAGLIHGLGTASQHDGQLNTKLLIDAVAEAFYVSAAAITAAMIVTFVEKWLLASLHKAVEELCRQIDSLYAAGAGEEYLSRLVHASEESASQARILKDALVGELSAILERLTQQQIAASAAQQASLQQTLVSAIDRGLTAPLGELAQGLTRFQSQQGTELTQSLQDSMSAFADKLDQLLGGQVGQARELQQQTLLALEKSVAAFEGMARDVAHAGVAATATMSSQLDKAIADMAGAQGQMNTTMRAFVDELRASATQAQADTSKGVETMLAQLGQQLNGALRTVRDQSSAASEAHREHLGSISASTQTALAELAECVRNQSTAVEHATAAMRGAVAELGSSAQRNISLMGQGADQMRQAAERFTESGGAIADVFDRSKGVTAELSQTATRLSASSQDVETVIRDYRAARETFAGIVEGLRGTVDTAKREVAMTSDLVSRLETAAQKLIAAQGHADEYLARLNGVLAEAHSSFSTQMLQTVRSSNGEFHDSLRKATGLLANTIAEFEQALGDNRPDPSTPRKAA